MKLRLEFIERRQIAWWGLACLAVVLAWCGVLLVESLALREAAASQAQRAGQLAQTLESRRRAALQLQAKSDPEAQRRAQEQRKIMTALQYPWTRILSTMEQADSNDVAILSLSHEQAAGQTQISIEALDTQALVRFVDALNDGGDEGGQHWYLASYQLQPQNMPPTVKAMVLNK